MADMSSKQVVVESSCPCPESEVVSFRHYNNKDHTYKYLVPGTINQLPYLEFIEAENNDRRILFEIKKLHDDIVTIKSRFANALWYRNSGDWIIPNGSDEQALDRQFCILNASGEGEGPKYVRISSVGADNKFLTCKSPEEGKPECLIASMDSENGGMLLQVVSHPHFATAAASPAGDEN
ncbi:hypothetical protein CsatA_005990 [Cannabis sativa]